MDAHFARKEQKTMLFLSANVWILSAALLGSLSPRFIHPSLIHLFVRLKLFPRVPPMKLIVL